ncbi:MAG TPA: DUF2934 domain-containing protein, partial [Candidatus Omnitrophota bacterium]|nr:DUF2934 domain-containing protein [Candidatus Omnitrophota bacterium]
LTEMAELVTTATLAAARSGTPQAIEPLIAMDLSLSKLLSDATLEQMTRDRAYYLWQEAGCPHGNDQEYWFTAANEIQGLRASLR